MIDDRDKIIKDLELLVDKEINKIKEEGKVTTGNERYLRALAINRILGKVAPDADSLD